MCHSHLKAVCSKMKRLCDIMYHMTRHWIIAITQRRQAKWERLFGADRLPVMSPATRHDAIEQRPCYDLDLGRLTSAQRDRLAAYVERVTGRDYLAIRAEVEAAISWPVSAAGCEIVTDDETVARPSLLLPALGYSRLALAG